MTSYQATIIVTLLIILTGTAFLAAYEAEFPRPAPIPLESPLTDTLITNLKAAAGAARANNSDQFFSLVASGDVPKFKYLAGKHGFPAIASIVHTRFFNWPDPDTLSLQQIKVQGQYVRLVFFGPGSKYGYREPRTHFTLILFERINNRIRLTDMNCFERPTYDMYGYTLPLHETDLPVHLRFPRI